VRFSPPPGTSIFYVYAELKKRKGGSRTENGDNPLKRKGEKELGKVFLAIAAH
jgi:hypothetical protein